MNRIEQYEIWHKNNQFQEIVDAIQGLPQGERSPEVDSQLARAYNNLAGPEDKDLFQKAVDLLLAHEDYFAGDHNWNFRLAYAYYYLEEEGLALYYFEQALAARPGDEDTMTFIQACQDKLDMPRFKKTFRERTLEAWEIFRQREGELRALLDKKDRAKIGPDLVAICDDILSHALASVSFELGYNGHKYELILTPEGDKAKLFELAYFSRQAPKSIEDKWNIWVGRPASKGFGLQSFGYKIEEGDVEVLVERLGDKPDSTKIGLTLYCRKLLALLEEDEDKAWWMLATLTDQVLGELPAMTLIEDFRLVRQALGPDGISLAALPQKLKEMGISLAVDLDHYLANNFSGYQMEPKEELEEGDWRRDVIAGSTCLVPLVNQFLKGQSEIMDCYHRDGVVAGFFYYPLYGFREEENYSQALFAFRDALENAILNQAGPEAVSFIGGASGIYYGYLDFIAWDLPPVLEAAGRFFATSGLDWASFHVFRSNVGGIDMMPEQG